MRARRTSRWRTRWCRSARCSASFTSPCKCLKKRSPSSRHRKRRCRTVSGQSPGPPLRRAPSARSSQQSAITARWPGLLSTATGSGPSSPRRKPISRRTDGSAVRRRLLLGCLAATAVGAGLPANGHEAPGAGRDREAADAAAPAFGPAIDFELTDAGGNQVRAVDLRGRWLLIFFGYTSCPDLCPTTLSEIAGALAQLGPLAARVQPVFVSIDPQRDTPQALRDYVQKFDARILPLCGNAEQLARAAASDGVVFYKVSGPTPDEYTFAHNAIVTLVGPEGGIVTRFSSDAVVDDLARRPGRLVDPGKAAWRIGMRSRYVRTPGEGGTGGRQN